MTGIHRAAEQGHFCVEYAGIMDDDTKEILKGLGYRIGIPYSSGPNETSTQIYWAV